MAVLAILIPGLLVFSSGFAGCPSAAGLFIGVRRLPLCWSFHQGSQVAPRGYRTSAWVAKSQAVWSDILHTRGYQLFIPSYLEWLKHT